MLPLGSLLIGIISEKIGAPTTLLFEGIAGLIIALAFRDILIKNKRNSTKNQQLLNDSEELFINKT